MLLRQYLQNNQQTLQNENSIQKRQKCLKNFSGIVQALAQPAERPIAAFDVMLTTPILSTTATNWSSDAASQQCHALSSCSFLLLLTLSFFVCFFYKAFLCSGQQVSFSSPT